MLSLERSANARSVRYLVVFCLRDSITARSVSRSSECSAAQSLSFPSAASTNNTKFHFIEKALHLNISVAFQPCANVHNTSKQSYLVSQAPHPPHPTRPLNYSTSFAQMRQTLSE